MLTRTLLRRSRSVDVAPLWGDRACQLPCALRVYSPVDSHTCQTPWSVFQDGSNGEPAGQRRERAVAEARRRARAVRHDRGDGVPRHIDCPGFGRRLNPLVRAPSDRRTGSRRSTSTGAHRRPHPLPSRQFQALFDSLFKVLFIFPSRYLFAIGLSPVFSLGRNLPPDWGCIPKQPDSPTAPRGAAGSGHDGALTLSGAPFQGTWARSAAEDASPDYNSDGEAARFSSWAIPAVIPPDLGSRSEAFGSNVMAERTTPSTTARELRFQPPLVVTGIAAGSHLGRPRARAHGRPVSAPRTGRWGATRCVTPRQTCPGLMASGATCVQRLDGSRDSAIHTKYRISLRSSSMREPRYPLPRVVLTFDRRPLRTGAPRTGPPRGGRFVRFSLARSAPGFVSPHGPRAAGGVGGRGPRFVGDVFAVQWTSRDVAGSEPPTSPRSEHFTGPFNRFSFQLQSATVSVLLPLFLFLADEITSVCQKICTLPPIVLAEGHQLALSFATAVSVSVLPISAAVSVSADLLCFFGWFAAEARPSSSRLQLSFSGNHFGILQLLPAVKGRPYYLLPAAQSLSSIYSRPCYLQPTFLPAACLACLVQLLQPIFLTLLTAAAVGACLQAPMAKGKRSKTQAATTGNSGKVAAAAAATAAAAIAAADTATTATAAADLKDNTKATSFQAFISDLEASPSFPLSHACADNTSDRQEEELPANKGKETLATVSAKPSFASLFSTNRRMTMDNKLSKFQIDEGTITLESND
ncbi:UNVERIFIED_CONTAM: putative uncharacterized protein ART3 [Sesamum angustifolium]|uniref:Transmembrane protein n=1 Tax=Sesamum angustifolium TaxID=2727405 RepID=A0AAW2Q8A8_9LAMI